MACAPSLVLSWLCRLMDNHSHVLVDLTHSPTINCSSATSCDITCNTAYSACTVSIRMVVVAVRVSFTV